MNNETTSPSRPEVLEGAKAIAAFMGFQNPRSIYSAVEANNLPVFRVGKKICARRAVLHAFMVKQESKANSPALRPLRAAEARAAPATA